MGGGPLGDSVSVSYHVAGLHIHTRHRPAADLRQLSMQINAEREMFKVKLAECCKPLGDVFMLHCQVRRDM